MPSNAPIVFRGGPLSNFAACNLRLAGFDGTVREYPTVEHYFQAAKATTREDHERIRCAESPRAAKRAGRAVQLRADWEQIKDGVMREALTAKFSDEPFRTKLLGTGDRPIIEESLYDIEWGARRTPDGWEGANRLGELLAQVRHELRAAGPRQLSLVID